MITPLTTRNSSMWLKEKDLGIIAAPAHIHGTSKFCVNAIASKANKLLGLLKRTCPQLTNVSVRTLYLSPVKSQLCFGTQLWSPSHSHLQGKIERVQRRATRWILRSRIGEMSYKERIIRLDMLLLVLWQRARWYNTFLQMFVGANRSKRT